MEKQLSSKKSNQISPWFGVALLFSVIYPAIFLWPSLTDPFRVTNDMQNHYWIARFQNPDLFPDDLLPEGNRLIEISLFNRTFLVYPTSMGYGLIYFLAGTLMDPFVFGRLLVFFLMPLSAIYVFRLGKLVVGNDRTAFFLSILFIIYNLASTDSMSVSSGLQRAFALPLLIAFLYYLEKKKYFILSCLLVVGALIYAPIMVLMALTFGFSAVAIRIRPNFFFQIKREFISPLIIGILFSGIIAVGAFVNRFNFLNPDAQNDLVRRGFNRELLFIGFPWWGRLGFFEMDIDGFNFLVLLCLCGMVYFVVGKSDLIAIPKSLRILLIAGMTLYVLSLASVLLFSAIALYLPPRYSRYPLFLLPLFFVGLNFRTFMQRLLPWIQGKTKLIIGILLVFLMSLALLSRLWYVGAIFFAFGFGEILAVILVGLGGIFLENQLREHRLKPFEIMFMVVIFVLSIFPGVLLTQLIGSKTINPTPDERNLYTYLATLPEDIMIAGSPRLSTGIPLFSKRNVIFREWIPDANAPIVALMDTYYHEDPAAILDFCDQQGIDYWVMDGKEYEDEFIKSDNFFDIPYQGEIRAKVSGRTGFALKEATPVFISGSIKVIPCTNYAINRGQ